MGSLRKERSSHYFKVSVSLVICPGKNRDRKIVGKTLKRTRSYFGTWYMVYATKSNRKIAMLGPTAILLSEDDFFNVSKMKLKCFQGFTLLHRRWPWKRNTLAHKYSIL